MRRTNAEKAVTALAEKKPLNREQRKFLERRILDIVRIKKSAVYDVHFKDPPNIKVARRLVETYDNAVLRRKDKMRDAINDAASKCRQAMLFCPADEAIGIVDLFEGLKV